MRVTTYDFYGEIWKIIPELSVCTPFLSGTLPNTKPSKLFVVVVLLFYVHGKHLRSYRDGQLT